MIKIFIKKSKVKYISPANNTVYYQIINDEYISEDLKVKLDNFDYELNREAYYLQFTRFLCSNGT